MWTPQPWNWQCPQPLTPPWKSWFLEPLRATSAPRLMFEVQNLFLKSILKSFHMFKYGFWWRFRCLRAIMDAFATPWKQLEAFGEKKIFRIFSTFFKHFLLHFSFKMKQKWKWKNRKCNFFKNEALNWKSATVKVLGYMLTVSDDCEDPPTMKLVMPPASNSLHEIHGFQSLSKPVQLQSWFSSSKIGFWKVF